MRNILMLLFVLLVPKIAPAMDWYVYASTDPSQGQNTYEVSRSTDIVLVPFEGTNFECGVSAVSTYPLVLHLTFSVREIRCAFSDENVVAASVSCIDQEDSFKINYLTIMSGEKEFEISVQCLNSIEEPDEQSN